MQRRGNREDGGGALDRRGTAVGYGIGSVVARRATQRDCGNGDGTETETEAEAEAEMEAETEAEAEAETEAEAEAETETEARRPIRGREDQKQRASAAIST